MLYGGSGEVNPAITVSAPPSDLAQRAVRAMVQHRIPATPENYHVWYNHLAHIDADLSHAIDAYLHTRKPFADDVNAELYKTYVLPKYSDDQIRRIQEDMQAIVKDVLDSVSSVDEATAEYTTQLESSAKHLATHADAADVRSVLRLLADKTIGMARTARESQESLKEATVQIHSLHEQLKETEEAVLRDPLTGLFNRKATDQRLRVLESAFRDSKTVFSVVMGDIDHFKKFNDTFGHQVGDAVLRLVAKVLKDSVKGKDFVARFGGEEFIALLPDTPRDGAAVVADQIREAVQAQRCRVVRTEQEIPQITLSLGVAEFAAGDSADSVVHRADQALYLAKRSGRNAVKTDANLPHPT